MRLSLALILLGVIGLALVVCDVEAIATARRWNPQDMGRTASLSFQLAARHNLTLRPGTTITIRVDTPHDVRVYRYRVPAGDPSCSEIVYEMDPEMMHADASAQPEPDRVAYVSTGPERRSAGP